ncbi:MAG: hypothetical protein WC241_02745 [Candidatus Paceibacterota bacterium]|jgi:hypothetical protein
MKHYPDSGSLKSTLLREEDTVQFGPVKYVVVDGRYGFYLNNLADPCRRSEIFSLLEITNSYEFCKKYYGYDPQTKDSFPETRKRDSASITKLVMALMKLCEMRTVADARKECACIKTHPKTATLIKAAEKLEKELSNRKPEDKLTVTDKRAARELFNLAEDEILKKNKFIFF